jgi:hypothetical protein
MRRAVPNRSLLSSTAEPEVNYQRNFCPLPTRQVETTETTEAEKLIIRYRELIKEIKTIRGKLYTQGIDPEKYI